MTKNITRQEQEVIGYDPCSEPLQVMSRHDEFVTDDYGDIVAVNSDGFITATLGRDGGGS